MVDPVKVSEKKRAEAQRLYRHAQNAGRAYELYVAQMAEEENVPWPNNEFKLETGEFVERKPLQPPKSVGKKP